MKYVDENQIPKLLQSTLGRLSLSLRQFSTGRRIFLGHYLFVLFDSVLIRLVLNDWKRERKSGRGLVVGFRSLACVPSRNYSSLPHFAATASTIWHIFLLFFLAFPSISPSCLSVSTDRMHYVLGKIASFLGPQTVGFLYRDDDVPTADASRPADIRLGLFLLDGLLPWSPSSGIDFLLILHYILSTHRMYLLGLLFFVLSGCCFVVVACQHQLLPSRTHGCILAPEKPQVMLSLSKIFFSSD